MADEEQDGDDKPFDASQKKLDDARRKGEVPHSADLTSAGTFAGVLLAAAAFGSQSLLDLGAALSAFLAQPEQLSSAWVTGPVAPASTAAMAAVLAPLAPLFGLPFLAALLVVIAQRAFVIAPEKLVPKLERISPISGIRNKFGRNGLFEFAKSTVKLIVVSGILAAFVIWRLPRMLASMALDTGQVTVLMLQIAVEFLTITLAVILLLGAIDAMWQRAEHARKHRMSKKELADEQKESEGDPWIKGRRREKGVQIATNRMLADVPGADVVIVNPTHYAVALCWDRGMAGAPVCVAKGTDEVARRIREVAGEAGVPIHSDPPTARALWQVVGIGEEIAPEHYRAVAVAIRFAEAVRERAGKTGGR